MSKGLISRQNEEQMNVIGGPARGEQGEAFVTGNSAEIGIEGGHARDGDEWTAVLCAKDTVDEIVRVCVSHFRRCPYGTPILRACVIPTLKRGASNHCAYGAVAWPARDFAPVLPFVKAPGHFAVGRQENRELLR